MPKPPVTESVAQYIGPPSIAHIATVDPYGGPHVTPVWIELEDDRESALLNVDIKTQKWTNVQRDARSCVSLVPPHNQALWIVVWGVSSRVDLDGVEHLQTLAQKYLGRPKKSVGERIVLKLEIERYASWLDNGEPYA